MRTIVNLDDVNLRVTCGRCGNGILIRPAAFEERMVICTACMESAWPREEVDAIKAVAMALRKALAVKPQLAVMTLEVDDGAMSR